MIAIKLPKMNRYIRYNDNCWYESSSTPLFIYPDRTTALKVCEDMAKKYQYHFLLEYDDNTPTESICTLKRLKPKHIANFTLKKLNLSMINI